MKFIKKDLIKKALVLSAASAFIVLIIAVALFFCVKYYSKIPYSESEKTVIIDIQPGTGLIKTSGLLKEKDLIKSSFIFKAYAVIIGFDKKIRAGEYELRKNMTPSEILTILAEGKVKLYKIVIPEGYALSQIALIVEESGLSDKKSFMESATDREFIHSLGIKADSIEGYLFPETYLFPKKTSPKKIIKTMVAGLFKIYTPDFFKKSEQMGLSLHETLTLASIIEKETGSADERPIISSVFHNRLKIGMRLETDPTVIYGINDFDGNLTRKDLETPTPYNTYIISGLPPGPIASPGESAIKAALYPADTKYLYFVSKNDSTHHFSVNYKEHQNAVRQYQFRRKQD